MSNERRHSRVPQFWHRTFGNTTFVVWATYALCQWPKLSAVCDWLSWLTCVPVDQSQSADSLGCWHSTYVTQTQNIVGREGHCQLLQISNFSMKDMVAAFSEYCTLKQLYCILYINKIRKNWCQKWGTFQLSRLHVYTGKSWLKWGKMFIIPPQKWGLIC